MVICSKQPQSRSIEAALTAPWLKQLLQPPVVSIVVCHKPRSAGPKLQHHIASFRWPNMAGTICITQKPQNYLSQSELCNAMPCHAMPCHAMPCHAMLCYAMLCLALLCYAMLCLAMLCYALLCCACLGMFAALRPIACSPFIIVWACFPCS